MKKILIICILGISLQSQAQTNGGFETWHKSFGFEDVSGWISSNLFKTIGFTDSLSCFKSNNACNSAYSVKLKSFTVDFITTYIAPGTLLQQVPYTNRAKSFRYCYTQNNKIPDTATISVEFYKGTTDDTANILGSGIAYLTPSKSWVTAAQNITWFKSGNPDSVVINIESGSEGKTSELLLDNFSISEFAAGITDVKPLDVNVYLDMQNYLHIDLKEIAGKSQFLLVNRNGQVVYQSNMESANNTISLPTISAGLYAWTIKNSNGILSVKTGKIYIP